MALSPAGLWRGWERRYVFASLRIAHALAKVGARHAERLMRIRPLRLALAQFFARPMELSPQQAAAAVRVMAESQSFGDLIAWTSRHEPTGLHRIEAPVLIAWGTRDRLLFGRQADRFVAAIQARGSPVCPTSAMSRWPTILRSSGRPSKAGCSATG